MRLTVFGASGGVGQEIVRHALTGGHDVTAVVRDRSRLPVTGERLEIVEVATLDNPEELEDAVAGRDAVLSAVGPRSRKLAGSTAPVTRTIREAMELAGVRRLLVVSASPLGPVPEGQPFLLRTVITPIIEQIFKENYVDLRLMEADLAASGLDWTAVRPPQLLNTPTTGVYRTAIDANLRGGRKISRGDVAHAMLAMVGDKASFGHGVGVAY
ncbi:epimerase [Arthrobacter sp. ERGS1:01]|uniref:NAD(P)-dependent oxidoreductase n=1 Tax=Arthrobacter sp. ERGS1:01 TaxID=1704044 RepID=UPI0006B56569|nr:NAD(P)H-binding protein [Arthrobacter sp. ERGS1:01]ALE07085.1 epimerase [Arthrobacter sp. ERGS1:01]